MSELGTSDTGGSHFIHMVTLIIPIQGGHLSWIQMDSVDRPKNFATVWRITLVQHVTTPTRNENILDLVITDELDMVADVVDLGVLATSGHHAVQRKLLASTVSSDRTGRLFDYAKADICRIKPNWPNRTGKSCF